MSTLFWNNSHTKHQRNALLLILKIKILEKYCMKKILHTVVASYHFRIYATQLGNPLSRILEYNCMRAVVYTFVHCHIVCGT